MVKREVVLERLNKLNEYIEFLKKVKNYSKEELYINALITPLIHP